MSGAGAGFTLLQNFVVDIHDDADESLLTTEYLTQLLPTAYGSQTFTECERRYANIERKLLAMVCGIEKFNYYMFGRNTINLSDHKTLLSIILKDLINAPPRLQRMLLRLHKYNVTIVYHKGSEIVFEDHLSRNLDTKTSETGKITELDKLSIAHVDLNVSQVNLHEIKEKTKLYPELIQVSMLIVSRWPLR